uniref:Uncharacterized protein n=1 Tax=Anopheles atroparvus TaxID=41427 RepID=A0A182IMS2_ANOAO
MLTGIIVFVGVQQSGLNDPCLVTSWKLSNWFSQSYEVSRRSRVMPASSAGDAMTTGLEQEALPQTGNYPPTLIGQAKLMLMVSGRGKALPSTLPRGGLSGHCEAGENVAVKCDSRHGSLTESDGFAGRAVIDTFRDETVARKDLGRGRQSPVVLVARVDVGVVHDRLKFSVATNLRRRGEWFHLPPDQMRSAHDGENVDALAGKRSLCAGADAVALRDDLLLPGRNDMAPVGVQPHREDSGVELAQLVRVVQLEARVVHHLLLHHGAVVVLGQLFALVRRRLGRVIVRRDVHVALLLAQVLPVERRKVRAALGSSRVLAFWRTLEKIDALTRTKWCFWTKSSSLKILHQYRLSSASGSSTSSLRSSSTLMLPSCVSSSWLERCVRKIERDPLKATSGCGSRSEPRCGPLSLPTGGFPGFPSDPLAADWTLGIDDDDDRPVCMTLLVHPADDQIGPCQRSVLGKPETHVAEGSRLHLERHLLPVDVPQQPKVRIEVHQMLPPLGATGTGRGIAQHQQHHQRTQHPGRHRRPVAFHLPLLANHVDIRTPDQVSL